MDPLLSILTGTALAMDCFIAAVCISSTNATTRSTWLKVPLAFGLFQGGMLALGFLLGGAFAGTIAGADHWIAFTLLAIIGGKMIYEGLHPEQRKTTLDNTHLFLLAVATSIDAFVVGFAVSLVFTDVLDGAFVVGVVTAFCSLLGLFLGAKVQKLKFVYTEAIAGLVLIGIGLKILLQHLLG